MENKQDEKLVALSKAGDKQATDLLLQKYSDMVRSCARRYFLIGGETDDLVQEGMIAMYHSVNDYDSSKGMSFKNFAYLCVSRRIIDAVKSVYNKKNTIMRDVQPLDMQMVETGLSPDELLILDDERKEFRQKMSKLLSDFEFKIMTRYMDGLTIVEICEETGKSYKSVDNAIQHGKKKLRKFLKK